MSEASPPRWPVVAGALVGGACIAVGLRALLGDAGDTRPSATVTWVLGLAVAHDLVLVPLVLAIGEAIRRLAPGALRPWLGAGLLISGSVALVAWPLVQGYGRSAGNPSALPRDYGTGTAITLAVVWACVAAAGLRRFLARNSGGPPVLCRATSVTGVSRDIGDSRG